MSANLNIIQTIAPFICPNLNATRPPLDISLYPCALNYFPALNCLLTNGKPGHLQFYAHDSEKLLFNVSSRVYFTFERNFSILNTSFIYSRCKLDVVDENYISPENLDKPLVHTQIECVALNHDCQWLATVERRNDSSTTPDVKLKFWFFDKITKK
jgi:hypothetical protein